VQAQCGPGLAQASDIDILSTLRDDNIINVHSSSSYELFLFSSKADSAHEGVDRRVLVLTIIGPKPRQLLKISEVKAL
jgi:hypothetical protein